MQKPDPKKLDYVLSDAIIPLRISCLKPNNCPIVISLWYEIVDGKIYCATQNSAKVVSYLQKNPSCGFEIAGDKPPYKGVRGEGTARIIKDRGSEILNILIAKYLGDKESGLSRLLKQNSGSEVAIEITPQKTFQYDYSKRMRDVNV